MARITEDEARSRLVAFGAGHAAAAYVAHREVGGWAFRRPADAGPPSTFGSRPLVVADNGKVSSIPLNRTVVEVIQRLVEPTDGAPTPRPTA